jgi:TM2 domain-containing membrane protein YozV
MRKTFALFLLVLPRFVFAQISGDALELQKRYADSLFNAENYYQAITEYKRLAFFDYAKKYAYDINYKIALAYKEGGFYDNAKSYFKRAVECAENIEQKEKAQIEAVKNFILARKTDDALNYLDELESAGEDESEINYWRGWAHLFAGRLNLSARYFYLADKNQTLARQVDTYADSLYSVSNVKLLSYIIPGAGQIYVGEYFSGLMSFAWNALWIYVTANAFADGRIIEGFLVGDLLWLRFYRGNIQNAERFANEKNVKLLNRLLGNLQRNYRGEKP